MHKIKLGKKEILPFTIPSGIITTEPATIEKLAHEIIELGIITTKTIGPEPRPGNPEPVLYQYEPGSFVNAVGLKNPGCKAFAEKLSKINFPKDKYLLISVMGANAEDFCTVIKTLEPYADGFELNLSCPHAKGYGQQIGEDPKLVFDIVNAACAVTKKEIFAKLSPNVTAIGKIAQSAVNAGAYGITAINTVGPDEIRIDEHPVLSNKYGGRSGRSVLQTGLAAVKEIRATLPNTPILGMGGIRTATDIKAYEQAGANLFGIGSALAGLTDDNLKTYFSHLQSDLTHNTNTAEKILTTVDMSFKKTKLMEKYNCAIDLKILKFDTTLKTTPGQFVFVWIPGVGEKPFSILDDDPLTLAIQERGKCTSALNNLSENDEVYIRGPYGKGLTELPGKNIVLVGGGSGIAGLYLFAKHFKNTHNITTILGAKDKDHVFYENEFEKFGTVYITTEDGSKGSKGYVTDVLANSLQSTANSHAPRPSGPIYINCGPKPMIEAVLKQEEKITDRKNIFSSVDYLTMCGVGICGSCANHKGQRTCVEGPFV